MIPANSQYFLVVLVVPGKSSYFRTCFSTVYLHVDFYGGVYGAPEAVGFGQLVDWLAGGQASLAATQAVGAVFDLARA